jgi:ATP-binding cassette subfamily B protein
VRIGDITTAIFLLSGLYAPLGMLGFQYREIRQGLIDMEQMVSLKTIAPDIVDSPTAQPLPPASGKGASIAFDDVSFRHDARSSGLLGVSFTAEPGQTVALVGPLGRGQDHRRAPGHAPAGPPGRAGADRRRRPARGTPGGAAPRVALVPQDVALFNDTLYANIGFARPTPRPRRCAPPPTPPSSGPSSTACRTAWPRGWASAA